MIKVVAIINIITLIFILFLSLYKIIKSYKNIDSIFKNKLIILPKSFFTSVVLVPMIGCWLFFIHNMLLLRVDHSYLIIFCCIFIPLFNWWIIKNIGD